MTAEDADQVLTTTRAVRKRLDLTRPVPRDLLLECLDIAVQAPTGSNRQGWHFVFVSDADRKTAIANHYRRSWEVYRNVPPPAYDGTDVRARRMESVKSSAQYLADHMHEAPWLMIPVAQGRLREGASVAAQASLWGSILPAFWSFMLAARARGLGTAWTTLHLRYEEEAAQILGIPYAEVMQAALIPVAYTLGTDFKPAPRTSLDSIVHWEQW